MALDTTTPSDQAGAVDDNADMRMMPLDEIVESKRNTRTRVNPAKDDETAESIKAQGVLQPILVRPLPASRLQETFTDLPKGKRPGFEIIAGHRRYRLSKRVGRKTIPVLIRHLDDAQALRAQLVENLQREDLHPMEEAEGYERLVEETGVKKDDIGTAVGKSRSYVYGRLKLLEMCQEARKAFYAGKIDVSVALLIARIPDHKLQIRALGDITRSWMGEEAEPLSYRAASDWVQQNVMLKLSDAKFKIHDANLVPAAGSCKDCGKRTGANPDLFSDVKSADVCTDTVCFNKKDEAHVLQLAAAAKAKGQTVIEGKEAKELMKSGSPKGYTLLDEKEYLNGRYTSYRSAIGKAELPTPVLMVNPDSGKLVEMIPTVVANRLIAKAKASGDGEPKRTPEAIAREKERAYEAAWHKRALETAHAALMAGKMKEMSVDLCRLIARKYNENSSHETDQLLCQLFTIGKVAANPGLDSFLKSCPANQVAPVLLLLMLAEELDDDGYSNTTDVQEILGTALGFKIKSVQEQVKSEIRAAEEEAKLAAAKKAAPAPAAQAGVDAKGKAQTPTPAAGKPAKGKAGAGSAGKTTKEEAKLGIAEAMQAAKPVNDFKVGDKVRFKVDLKGPQGMLRKVCGREGTISVKHGDRGWMVKYGEGKNDIAGADYTEIEHAFTLDEKDVAKAWPFPKAAKP